MTQAPPVPQALTEVQQLQIGMFFKFLQDAANLLGNNPLPAAQQARIRIEEGLYWGKMAIEHFRIQQQPDAPANPVEPQATAPAETPKVDNSAPEDIKAVGNAQEPQQEVAA